MSRAPIGEQRLTLRSTVEAPALGRQALNDILADVPTRIMQDAQLLLTEVMTNAIRHAGLRDDDRISVLVRGADDHVEVEVSNRGTEFEPAVLAPDSRHAGWGLMLLDRIAEEWGVRRHPDGVAVWFRLRYDEV